jgi:Ser/Thr protein kinase RdoA (MazF antagonist)
VTERALSTQTVSTLTEVLAAGWHLQLINVNEVHDLWFTGKLVAQVETNEGTRRLARYPQVDRRSLVRALGYQESIHGAGCGRVPNVYPARGGLIFEDEGAGAWSVTDWALGSARDDTANWSTNMFEQLGAAVGDLHRFGRTQLPHGAAPKTPPEQYWTSDWRGFEEWARRSWSELTEDSDIRTATALAELRRAVDDGLTRMSGLLEIPATSPTVTHDDLWTEHILWEGDELTGIIDLDGLDAGAAAGDVAALLSDFADMEPRRCGAVVRGYRALAELSRDEVAAMPHLVFRHHLLVLIERVRQWRDRPSRRDNLLNPLTFWLGSVRRVGALEIDHWTRAVEREAAAGPGSVTAPRSIGTLGAGDP